MDWVFELNVSAGLLLGSLSNHDGKGFKNGTSLLIHFV